MFLFQIFLIGSLIPCPKLGIKDSRSKYAENLNKKCNQMDLASVQINFEENLFTLNITNLELFYKYNICNSCDFVLSKSFAIGELPYSIIMDSNYGYYFMVNVLFKNSTRRQLCNHTACEDFGECGEYLLQINSNSSCFIQNIKEPNDTIHILLIGIVAVILVIIFWNLIEHFLKAHNHTMPDNRRLKSLDAFRGISLFLMIFSNYGSGGYKFLQHADWHGLHMAGNLKQL